MPIAPRVAFALLLTSIMAAPLAAQEAATPQRKPEPPTQAPTDAKEEDRWYVVDLMGGKAGWMNTNVRTEEGRITTRNRLTLSIGRADQQVKISMDSAFVETDDGMPLTMTSRQRTGQMEVEKTWRFLEDGIEVTTRQAGQSKTERVEKPTEAWLTPAAAEREVQRRFKAGEKEIGVATMDPMLGTQVVSSTRSGFEPATITIDGKDVEALKVTVSVDAMDGVTSTEYVDAEGEMLRSDTSMGGLAITMTRSTREKAMARPGRGAATPEIMLSTFVEPDKPIENPRATTRATYVLTTPKGAMPDLPSTGAQTAKRTGENSVRVTIDAATVAQADAADAANGAFTAPSTMLDSADGRIREFARRSLARMDKTKKDDAPARAEALRNAVREHIDEKELGVGLATATEVMRNKRGDCTEHAMLLAAALRAAEIPSRVATGLIFADSFAGREHIFGYHMWTQALLPTDGGGHAWVDLDATLGAETPFDATHIALYVTPMDEDDSLQGLLSVAQVLGNLTIGVEEVSHDAGAPPAPTDEPGKDEK